MAMNDASGKPGQGAVGSEATAQVKGRPSLVVQRSPAWIVPAYFVGLACLYLGQRVLVTFETLQLAFTVVGLTLAVGSTAYRFFGGRNADADRRRVENLMGLLAVLGLLAVGVYFAGTDWGFERLGLDKRDAASRDHIASLMNVTWVALLTASALPLLFAEIALAPMRHAALLESRRVGAAAASGFIVALSVVYGSLFVYSAGEAKVQADFSYFKTTEPGESTKNIVESLQEPLRVTAFFPDISEVKGEVQNYLTALARHGKVETTYVDRYLDPKLAKELKVSQDGTLVFQYKDRRRSVQVGTELATARSKLKELDKAVNTRLLKLVRDRYVAYLTVGHGELNDVDAEQAKATGRSTKALREFLEQLNFQIKDLGLAEGFARQVPEDATVVFVLGPTEPFAAEELTSLQQYARKGGHLFIALDSDSFSARLLAEQAELAPGAPGAALPGVGAAGAGGGGAAPVLTVNAAGAGATPQDPSAGEAPVSASTQTLHALAEIAGLKYNPTLLANTTLYVQSRSNAADHLLLVTNRFSSHSSVSTVGKRRRGVMLAGTGSLEKIAESGKKVDFTVRSAPHTFADGDGNYEISNGEKKASFNMAAAVTAPVAAGETPLTSASGADAEKDGAATKDGPEMRAFVIADADAVTDLVLGGFSENQFFLYDAVRWLGGEESYIGELNTEEDVRIEHTRQKDLAWFYSMVFGVPVVVLGAGITYTRRVRRKKGASK